MKITKFTPKANINARGHRFENGFIGAFIAVDRKGKPICELRLYETRARRYACFWGHAVPELCNGSAGVNCYQGDAGYWAMKGAGFELPRFTENDSAAAVEACAKRIAGRKFLAVIHAHA